MAQACIHSEEKPTKYASKQTSEDKCTVDRSSITSSPFSDATVRKKSVLLNNWSPLAFGLVHCKEQLMENIESLNEMLREDKETPPINIRTDITVSRRWLTQCDIGKAVALIGSVKGKELFSKTLQIEICPADTELDTSLGPVHVVVVKTGVGKNNFNIVKTSLQSKLEAKGHYGVIMGVVQERKDQNRSLFICLNDPMHVALLCPCYTHPTVKDMLGINVNFPFRGKDEIHRRLLGSFKHAWFCSQWPYNSFKQQLGEHIAAYRRSGGGIIYIGLKLNKKNETEVEYNGMELSSKEAEGLNDTIVDILNEQRPKCTPHEWKESTSLPNLSNRNDQCLHTYFRHTGQTKDKYVVRLIIGPSEHSLHLVTEAHINLKTKPGQKRDYYELDAFLQGMSSDCIEAELLTLVKTDTTSSDICIPEVVGKEIQLWSNDFPPEGGYVEYKEPNACPTVDFVIKHLVENAPAWLNGQQGAIGELCFGVSDKPHQATGIWLEDCTMIQMRSKILQRFQGSIQESNFCFPSAIRYLKLTKYPVFAHREAFFSKESKVLVIWLKVKYNSESPESYDNVRSRFCSDLKEILSLQKDKRLPFLVLLLNSSLLKPAIGTFPVVISSKPNENILTKINAIEEKITKGELQIVDKYEYTQLQGETNIIHPLYYILHISVQSSIGSRETPLHLCELPRFFHIVDSLDESDHIGGSPMAMDFQSIVLQCKCTEQAKLHLSYIFQPDVRPILITNVGSCAESIIEGLSRIPWTLVVDFEFGESYTNALKNLAISQKHSIVDLPLNEYDPSNLQAMKDRVPIYWIKALGSSVDLNNDYSDWVTFLAPALQDFFREACKMCGNKVNILVVWSHLPAGSDFVNYIATNLCIVAPQVRPKRVNLTVVSPAAEVLDSFKGIKALPHDKFLMKLEDLSNFLDKVKVSTNQRQLFKAQGGNNPLKGHERLLKSMQDNEMDFLYQGIENDLDMLDYDQGKAFFEGRKKFVRWSDFVGNNVVNRTETNVILRKVQRSLQSRHHVNEIHFCHYPGAGGSTIARHVLWQLKENCCCIIPFRIYDNLLTDIEDIIKLFEKPVLVLWDTNMTYEFDALRHTLSRLEVIFLCVHRSFIKNDSVKPFIEENLTFQDLRTFCTHLRNNIHFNESGPRLDDLLQRVERGEQVSLFLLMVTALENRYVKISSYVKDRINGVSENQKSILLQIAFADLYTGKPIYLGAVSSHEPYWEKYLPNCLYDLVTLSGQIYPYVHMRHNCIAETVISEIKGINKVDNPLAWGEWMAQFAVFFIKTIYKFDPPEGPDNPNNELERVYRYLFHDRFDFELPYFLSLMVSLAGSNLAIDCMKNVGQVLQSSRVRAHFHGDFARVHLYNNADVTSAIKEMKKAHKILPRDRTLHHQEGVLYYEAISLIKDRDVGKKSSIELATDLLNHAIRASACFSISRECVIGNRPNSCYPYITDVQCHIQCLKTICDSSLLNCTFHTLPKPLDREKYIQDFEEDTVGLLDYIINEDNMAYKKWNSELTELLGSRQDHEKLLQEYLKEITITKGEVKNLYQMAQTVKKINRELRRLHENARKVPVEISTKLTAAVYYLIQKNRIVNDGNLAAAGHQDRFVELELLWDWARYSNPPLTREAMLSVIDKYEGQLPEGSVQQAKCQLYKGVTLLLKRMCDNDCNVDPCQIEKAISKCYHINKFTNNSFQHTEFVIDGYGNGLLSSKDFAFHGSHKKINDSEYLNRTFDQSQHVRPQVFSGRIRSEGLLHKVHCNGLDLLCKPKPKSHIQKEDFKFCIAVSARDGLLSIPVVQLMDEESKHRFKLSEINEGKICDIDNHHELVYFELLLGGSSRARCQLRDLRNSKPQKGDKYQFRVNKRNDHFEAYDLQKLVPKE